MEFVPKLLGALVAGWFLHFVSAYVATRGKNFATRADVGRIENEIQRVRHDFERDRQERTHRHQLSLAALDCRLQAHQQAYARWWRLRHLVFKRDELAVA